MLSITITPIRAIADYDLPHSDIVIADVGTTIYRIGSSGWQRWDQWGARITPDWRGRSHAELYGLLGDFTDLQLPEKE
jgi:sucrose-6-phosphatase